VGYFILGLELGFELLVLVVCHLFIFLEVLSLVAERLSHVG